MEELFVDTSYFIALVNTRDENHLLAKEWADEITSRNLKCHISIPIIFEVADGFAKLQRREIGTDLINNVLSSDNYIVHSFSDIIYQQAWQLYASRKDKEWGLTDCYSFELMKEQNLKKALTADKHFEQYGYEILLK
ncbi:MAG TPA: PIN domain-containing protein [bacterium]